MTSVDTSVAASRKVATKTLLALGIGVAGTALAATVLVRANGPYTIAYATFAPLNTGIFIADADGSGERALVAYSTRIRRTRPTDGGCCSRRGGTVRSTSIGSRSMARAWNG